METAPLSESTEGCRWLPLPFLQGDLDKKILGTKGLYQKGEKNWQPIIWEEMLDANLSYDELDTSIAKLIFWHLSYF